jgi:hypothetical protein
MSFKFEGDCFFYLLSIANTILPLGCKCCSIKHQKYNVLIGKDCLYVTLAAVNSLDQLWSAIQ